MYYYSKYTFHRNPDKISDFIFSKIEGVPVEGFDIGRYKGTDIQYIRMSVPRSPNIRKYFAYCIEMKSGEVLTSVENFNDAHRTFGDAKNIGLRDLILIQMSDDMEEMQMYFVKNSGASKSDKQMAFQLWNDGNKLELA